MKAEGGEHEGPRFEFGGPCPKVGSWFFPADPSEPPSHVPEETESQGEKDGDAPQPA